jgi:predicted nucleic acid-binding protein
MNLFVDTSAWIALFDARDKYHPAASQAMHQIRHHAHLITSDYVLDETATYLLYRAGKELAVQCVQWIIQAPFIDLLYLGEPRWHDAWQMFQQYQDKQWAFTDCTSFVLMHQHHLHQAFTFDRHFEQAGFQLWPKVGFG